jgi:hypothetical protein
MTTTAGSPIRMPRWWNDRGAWRTALLEVTPILTVLAGVIEPLCSEDALPLKIFGLVGWGSGFWFRVRRPWCTRRCTFVGCPCTCLAWPTQCPRRTTNCWLW